MRGSRLLFSLLLFSALAVAGAALDRLAAPVWMAARLRQPALQLDSGMIAAGQGVTLALLGGFRTLVADVLWIRMYTLWEQRDLAGTQAAIQLVTAIDPRPLYFWTNGARILANDLAAWRLEAAGGYNAAGPAVEARISREQGSRAVALLETAMAFHPASAALWIERANIELHRIGDLTAAADSYRRAWQQPHAPYYAARIHAELLRRQGRKTEALEWLVQLHPSLPPEDDAAARDTVLGRIRELERELEISAAQAFQPLP